MSITLRTDLRPGDLGAIVSMHGILYAREHGFDATFEAYVAGPLAEFVRRKCPRERLWIAEKDGKLVGCIGIVAASDSVAQLRWFLVDPAARGQGLGKRLMRESLAFCAACEYESVFLWTISSLTSAAKIYRAAGFEKVESIARRPWGVEVFEERYVLRFPV